jgi:hypothetical protein
MSSSVEHDVVVGARKTKGTWGGWRPGAGRKPIFSEHADRTIRFERAELEALEALARQEGVKASDVVRRLVRAYIARRLRS